MLTRSFREETLGDWSFQKRRGKRKPFKSKDGISVTNTCRLKRHRPAS
jgi:hypothetical protein